MADITSPPAMAGDVPAQTIEADPPKLQPASDSAPRVLTPPTSEDMDKHDGNSSELSELEDDEDEDDIGEVEPDHYWDEENGGRIPVFKPVCRMLQKAHVASW
jgi:hypothetical protein